MRNEPDRVWMGRIATDAGLGALLGLLLATALVTADGVGLGAVMAASIGLLPGWALLAGVLGVAFGFMAAATAVMLTGTEPDRAGHGPMLVPVRVRRRSHS